MSARILIVEDNPDNLKLIEWLLEDAGYAFESAGTAERALELIGSEAFDVVLMDISLPDMDGKEITMRLRAQDEFKDLPIIAVTAHAVRGEDTAILASGVSALVTKPIDEDILMTTIRSFLSETVKHG